MNAAKFLCIGAAIGGLALVFGVRFGSIDGIGVALSVLGMVAITLLVFSVADVSKSVGPVAANFYMTLWSSLYLLIVLLIGPALGWSDAIALPNSITGWAAILATGVTTTAGYVLFFVGARIVGTTRAAIWTITEPLFAIFIAIALVNEWLSALQWIGVAIVVGSLFKFETNSRSRGRA